MLNRLWCMMVVAALSANAAELKFDFAETAVGKIPSGFRSILAGTGARGDWKVIMDDVPPLMAPLTDKAPSVTRRAVLAQMNQDATDERFPILLFDRETFGDFALSTRFKLAGGTTEQMAGFAFRVQDEKNFYVIRASGLGNNVRFYKVVGGERSAPIGPEIPVTKGVWHDLKIVCKANKIRCLLDGKDALPELVDNTFGTGKIGFWTKSDSLSYFVDTKIDYIPRVPLAQTVVQEVLKKNSRLIDLKIYALNDKGEAHVIGCKNEKEINEVGGSVEKDCIERGQIYYGKQKTHISVVMPIRDRNGENIAAVRLAMDTFLGQTESNALARARPIVKDIQERVQNAEELLQ
jgi:hypothetical protein